MYIYKLTQEYVKVRKLGQDFKDFIWRGLRIHPLFFFAYDFLLLIIEFEEQSRHRFVLSMYCKINRLTKQLTKLFKV